uniref:Uncharacterized protein n=1 Tax=Zea mays TaxID=4577 RepID=A0A804QCP8_MAIZE
MDDAAGNILASLGRVHLVDLVASEGLPSDNYKMCVSTLMQSLSQYSTAIIQLSPADGALLRPGITAKDPSSAKELPRQEVSSSVLSACCHSRPSFEGGHQHSIASQDNGHLLMFSEQEQQLDKTLLTLVKSDRKLLAM